MLASRVGKWLVIKGKKGLLIVRSPITKRGGGYSNHYEYKLFNMIFKQFMRTSWNETDTCEFGAYILLEFN